MPLPHPHGSHIIQQPIAVDLSVSVSSFKPAGLPRQINRTVYSIITVDPDHSHYSNLYNHTLPQVSPGFCFQRLPHWVGCTMLIEKFLEIPIQRAHFVYGVHGMVRGTEFAQ